jgi:hypothetical protein
MENAYRKCTKPYSYIGKNTLIEPQIMTSKQIVNINKKRNNEKRKKVSKMSKNNRYVQPPPWEFLDEESKQKIKNTKRI